MSVPHFAGEPIRLHIDWTRCDGRGLCTELLADILERDEWGYPIARPGTLPRGADPSDIPIPAHLREAAADAESLCPLLALKLRDRIGRP